MASARRYPGLRQRTRGAAKSFVTAIATVLGLVLVSGPTFAQIPTPGILAPGNAAVTGFSGAPPPAQIARGVDPAERTFIDVSGASLRVIDLQDMHGAPNAQLVNAPKPYIATAAQIGQVFAVALDNAVSPNIYVAASSAYGLPIVRVQAGGPLHVRRGGPGVTFMPGLWGSAAPGGGPGSIWKLDGTTGAVTLFANVALAGSPNPGPALGGLVFDPGSESLFVADRSTGMIHRIGMNGAERERYDHGVEGRSAQGLPPVLFDPSKQLGITSPQFDSEQPATWGYTAPERRIYGLGIRANRLYYAVAAGLQIWSVGLNADGSFSNDPRLELSVPPAAGPTEISKILFDDQGRMFLAERPDPTGAFDFQALTPEGIGRVLRYAIVDSQPGAPRIWQPVPDEYAMGFPLVLRNGNGGVAIGYNYDAVGRLDRGSCGGFLWSTGEQLRKATDPALAARLGRSGPPNVDGLQGNSIGLIRPMNVPPLRTYFIDYDDRFEEDDGARGYLGDIAIWRVCGPVLRGGWILPGWISWARLGLFREIPPPPRLSCPPDQNQLGFQCCPEGTSPDDSGQCRSWCPNGATDPTSQQICGLGFDQTSYDPNDLSQLRCIGGAKPDAAKGILGCLDKSPVFSAAVCQAGWSKQDVPNVGTICAPTPQQLQCGPGQQVSSIDGQCHNLCAGTAWPSNQCCAAGSVLSSTGQCCPAGSTPNPKTGACKPPPGSCPPAQMSSGGACCAVGWTPNNVSGGCCPPGQSATPGSGACKPSSCPPPGKMIGTKCCSPSDLQPGGACTVCPPEQVPVGAGNYCCDRRMVYTDRAGLQACCRSGKLANGRCETTTSHGVPVLPQCAPGSTDPKCCANGYKPLANSCCLASQITSQGLCCPAGQTPSGPNKEQCQPIRIGWYPPGKDGDGGTRTGGGGQCCLPGLIPAGDGSCCAPDQVTSTGVCCPAEQLPDPKNRQACAPTTACNLPSILVPGGCCPSSRIYRDASGRQQCCPQDVNQASGRCEPTRPRQVCATGYTEMPDGSCCNNHLVSADGRSCGTRAGRPVPVPAEPGCTPGWHRDPRSGVCVADRQCPRGMQLVAGSCVKIPSTTTPPPRLVCRAGQVPNAAGTACVTKRECPRGTRLVDGSCVRTPSTTTPPPRLVCRAGQVPNAAGTACVTKRECPRGMRLVAGSCVRTLSTATPKPRLVCRAGQAPNAAGTACITVGKRPPSGRIESKKPGGRIVVPSTRAPSSTRAPVFRFNERRRISPNVPPPR
jgi:hypothetical protein